MNGVPDQWSRARQALVPVLRSRTTPTNLVHAQNAGAPLIVRPASPFLHVLAAIEDDHTRTFVSHRHAAAWGLDPDAILDEALASLDVSAGLTPLGEHSWSLAGACVRATLPGFLSSFADRVHGSPIALVPTVGTLWVVGAEDPSLGELITRATALYRSAGGPISPVAYTQGMRPAELPHPEQAFALLVQAGTEYAREADLLVDLDALDGMCIASMRLERRNTSWISLASWTEPNTLLPKVDRVVVAGTEVPWSALAGRLVESPHTLLPRWLAAGLPWLS
jgi:hypothetical protein